MITKAQWVVVRTMGAGVHFGQVVQWGSDAPWVIELERARRCWHWQSDDTATLYTLSSLSVYGPAPGSRVDIETESITLTSVIEILPMSVEAVRRLHACGWGTDE